MSDRKWELMRAHQEAVAAAYERGLRRGMAIAREHEDIDERVWGECAEKMEREIEEAKR